MKNVYVFTITKLPKTKQNENIDRINLNEKVILIKKNLFNSYLGRKFTIQIDNKIRH
jgi:hypothetical protein